MQEKEFEHIFKCYYSDIYNFIYHYIMDGDDAEDLAQDVFICFFEKYKSLPERINSKQYLLSIAKNRCISFLRHKNVIDRNNLKYFETLLFSATSEYDTTYDDLFLMNSRERIKYCHGQTFRPAKTNRANEISRERLLGNVGRTRRNPLPNP